MFTCHSWRSNGVGFFLASFHFVARHRMPVEDEIPIEAAHLNRLDGGAVQLKRVVVDDLDERHGRDVLVARDRIDERFEPTLGALAMAVQEHEHLAFRDRSSFQTRSNETLAFRRTHKFHFLLLVHIVFQWFF